MSDRQIFVNLPVKDLPRSMELFRRLGFDFNPEYTDETAACMVVSDNIYVMLLTERKFAGFTPNPVCDAAKSTEVIVALSADSREDVDAMVAEALAAGGSTYSEPHDHGFM